jgi:hypothetical protein
MFLFQRKPYVATKRDLILLLAATFITWLAYIHRPEPQYMACAIVFTIGTGFVFYKFRRPN